MQRRRGLGVAGREKLDPLRLAGLLDFEILSVRPEIGAPSCRSRPRRSAPVDVGAKSLLSTRREDCRETHRDSESRA